MKNMKFAKPISLSSDGTFKISVRENGKREKTYKFRLVKKDPAVVSFLWNSWRVYAPVEIKESSKLISFHLPQEDLILIKGKLIEVEEVA